MFSSLKNKIKAEGVDVQNFNNNNNRMRSRFSSTLSINSEESNMIGPANSEQHNRLTEECLQLRSQCNELNAKITELNANFQKLREEKTRIEKTNEILLETVKVAQNQKDIYCEEQQKIQNAQQIEIDKLKNLLSFREHEAVERLDTLRQNLKQIEQLNAEIERLKQFEPAAEDLKDELQRMTHASQQEKNNLITKLAGVEEENRHLKKRLEIYEKSRINSINKLSANEQVQALVNERKLLEQHLEEAYLQLSDIKSSWSGQNLALETQLSRLSKQVAEETTEKRKAIAIRDDLNEKIKKLDFELLKLRNEIQMRDDKIQLLEEELDEVNAKLKETIEENEQQILYERNKVQTLETTNYDLNKRLDASEERSNDYAANAELIQRTMRQQIDKLENQINELQNKFEIEKEEKLTALLRNAEISQSEEKLKAELRNERDEINELHGQHKQLENDLKMKQQEFLDLQTEVQDNKTKIKAANDLQNELVEKNKTIKTLNQRLADLKKTLQDELRSLKPQTEAMLNNGDGGGVGLANGAFNANLNSKIVMDEVNFKYLKHVIIKFLTSREVEARHLIRAVATLLQLTKEEEKLLHDTLTWKMSWFGSKPTNGTGKNSISMPSS